jgi:hypothetical protein
VEPKKSSPELDNLKITFHFTVCSQTRKRLSLIFKKIRRLSSNKAFTTLHSTYFLTLSALGTNKSKSFSQLSEFIPLDSAKIIGGN